MSLPPRQNRELSREVREAVRGLDDLGATLGEAAVEAAFGELGLAAIFGVFGLISVLRAAVGRLTP